MTNENERDSVDDKCIGSQGQRKELKRASSGVKLSFIPTKQQLGRWVSMLPGLPERWPEG
jgi:hypothetical protein